MGNTKVNTDFSKYKTFTWAKSDPTAVGPNGYEIYYYEISPDRTQELNRPQEQTDRDQYRTDDLNRTQPMDSIDEDMDRMNQDSLDLDKSQREQRYNQRDQTQKDDQPKKDQGYNQRDKTQSDKTQQEQTQRDQSYNQRDNTPKDQTQRDTYQNENKPAGYTYSYTMIIPARDAAANETIRESISNELEGRGFRESGTAGASGNTAGNTAGADLIVSYQVLDQKATLHGFNNDVPEKAGNKEVRQPSDTATFALEPGTLMVSLIDAKTSEVVWNGWASGLIENRNFLTDQGQLKEAVHAIFEEFKHNADKAKKD